MALDNKYIIAGVIIFIIILIVLIITLSASSTNPLATLKKVINYIKNGTFSAPLQSLRMPQDIGMFNVVNTAPPYVSSYYGSDSYQSDLDILLQISRDTAQLTSLPADCYGLSTQVTTSMTPTDLQKIGNNLLLKIEPTLLVLCDKLQYANMAAVLVLFFNMIYSVIGINGSNFIIPTYDSNGNLLTIKYANNIDNSGNVVFLPVSYYLGILTDGYGPVGSKVTVPFMNPTQISAFLTAQNISQNRRALVTSIITNITNPLNNQRQTLLQQYPNSTLDIPAELFSKLMMTLLFTVWGGTITYNGMNCA